MKKNILKIILCMSFLLLSATQSHADQMKSFLLSCAYGTAAGAVVGLVSLAFTEDPNSKTNNIARGASIGLYAGIIFGIYSTYGAGANQNNNYDVRSPVWIEPQYAEKKIEGLRMNAQVFSF